MVNVLGLQRSDVCIVDLNRDTRSATEIGKGLRRALPGLNPSLVLVMGRFAVEALFGPDVSVEQLRQQWQVLEYEGGRVDLRVTHHPEAILLLGARGQSAPKMEAFHDLKAVSERLTST